MPVDSPPPLDDSSPPPVDESSPPPVYSPPPLHERWVQEIQGRRRQPVLQAAAGVTAPFPRASSVFVLEITQLLQMPERGLGRRQ